MLKTRIVSSLILLASTCEIALGADVEGALVTRKGASINGKVEGALVVLDEDADVLIAPEATVTGDVVVASERTAGGKAGEASGAKPAARLKLSIPSPASLKGRQRADAGFSLPTTEAPVLPKGAESFVVEAGSIDKIEPRKIKNLIFKNAERGLLLPPGAYGDVVIERGRIVLGAGPGHRTRYSFQSLTVAGRGALGLRGPVVVTVARLGRIDGALGNELYSNWLDLRVLEGEVLFGADSEIHGVVTASESTVSMGRGAKLRGGLFSNRASLAQNAVFTGVKPNWSKESSGNSLPLFIHKAARLSQRLPSLQKNVHFNVALNFNEDTPRLTIRKEVRGDSRLEAVEERRIYFEACCALFDGTGFDRGEIMMQGATASLADDIAVAMERADFENHLWAIAKVANLREGIRIIRESLLLQNIFMERSLKVARSAEKKQLEAAR